jgi:hypothetical protein
MKEELRDIVNFEVFHMSDVQLQLVRWNLFRGTEKYLSQWGSFQYLL